MSKQSYTLQPNMKQQKNVEELSSKVNIKTNIYLNVKYMVMFG